MSINNDRIDSNATELSETSLNSEPLAWGTIQENGIIFGLSEKYRFDHQAEYTLPNKSSWTWGSGDGGEHANRRGRRCKPSHRFARRRHHFKVHQAPAILRADLLAAIELASASFREDDILLIKNFLKGPAHQIQEVVERVPLGELRVWNAVYALIDRKQISFRSADRLTAQTWLRSVRS